MGLANQSTVQHFPFGFGAVFDGLLEVIPSVGLTLKSQDRVIGRVTASAKASMLSWGENLAIVVQANGPDSTTVGIESALKFGANIAGAHRHQKNFDLLISALSQHLQYPHRSLLARFAAGAGLTASELELLTAQAQQEPAIAATVASNGNTLLHAAAAAGSIADVQRLLDAGASKERRNGSGLMAWQLAQQDALRAMLRPDDEISSPRP